MTGRPCFDEMPYYEPLHPFGGVHATEYNVLNEAIVRCAQDLEHGKDWAGLPPDSYSHYDWLRQTQKLVIVTQLVDKLHELGYRIESVNT